MKYNILHSHIVTKLSVAFMALMPMWSCTELEDMDHYDNASTIIENSQLEIVNVSSEEYIKSRTDFSNMTQLFTEQGIFEELKEKGLLSTILMIKNDDFSINTTNEDSIKLITRSHISDISISPANLKDGDRLMMWHGKYVNITRDSSDVAGEKTARILFNEGVMEQVIQTNNGYIYVINDMVKTPTSLTDFINSLGEEYSIFKDLVLSSGGKEFDKVNSKAIGVNEQGNTVYDTVWIYTNAHFDNIGFDMNSESLTATLMLPSNDVINEALEGAHKRLNMWNMERADSILKQWILDVCFFNQQYKAQELNNSDGILKSIFSKEWRNVAQKVDTENCKTLSNGIVYPVEKLYIPNNVLMYRLKEDFCYYENCTDEQKASYYVMTNMAFSKCNTDVAAWSPLPGVWPLHENRVLILKAGEDGTGANFRLDYTPNRKVIDENGVISVEPYAIPPGAYRLAMGFKQNGGITFHLTVLLDGVEIAKTPAPITLSSSTTYHYDRGADLPNTYPENYDVNTVRELGGDQAKKAQNYNTDGGLIIEEVVIPDVKGDGSAVQVVFRFDAENWGEQTQMIFNHWCLRPTANNY